MRRSRCYRFPTSSSRNGASPTARRRFPTCRAWLSFRETPAALAALDKLTIAPDLRLVDGPGFAHPHRFDLAYHVRLLAGVPGIGVAKSRPIGSPAEPGTARGASADLTDHGEVVGTVVRTRADTRPVFVSVGHRIGFDSAVRLVLACTTRYRLPEPTRIANHLSKGRMPRERAPRYRPVPRRPFIVSLLTKDAVGILRNGR